MRSNADQVVDKVKRLKQLQAQQKIAEQRPLLLQTSGKTSGSLCGVRPVIAAGVLSACLVVIFFFVFSVLSKSLPSDSDELYGDEFSAVLLDCEDCICNDGSPYLYYLRKNLTSTKWLFFTSGGDQCHDIDSCNNRFTDPDSYHLMTSLTYNDTIRFGGALSANSIINPEFYEWNAVYMPYCTSDLWFGDSKPYTDINPTQWQFSGKACMVGVFDSLEQNLSSATNMVWLGGAGAGNNPVFAQLETFHEQYFPLAEVRAVYENSGTLVYNDSPYNVTEFATWLADGCALWNTSSYPYPACTDAGYTVCDCIDWQVSFSFRPDVPDLFWQDMYDSALMQTYCGVDVVDYDCLEWNEENLFNAIQEQQNVRPFAMVLSNCDDHYHLLRDSWVDQPIVNGTSFQDAVSWRMSNDGDDLQVMACLDLDCAFDDTCPAELYEDDGDFAGPI